MDRTEEYRSLLRSLEESAPPELEQAVERALLRKKALQKKRRMLGVPAGSLAACFAGFVLLVNCFPPFAAACEGIPVLGALASAVDWSPSLTAAVENDYVQPIGQTRSENGVTAAVEYVIVDQKQLNVFYTLQSAQYDCLDAEAEFAGSGGAALEGFGVSYSTYGEASGAIRRITADFVDGEMPPSLELTLRIYDSTQLWNPQPLTPDEPAPDYRDEMLEPESREERAYVAELTFPLAFDPEFTAQGERLPVDQAFLLDGQTLTLTEAELYPTHMRLNFAAEETNTAWLKSLEFEVENEHGERFTPIANGISAYGDTDSPMMASYLLESPYFAESEHLTLRITGARWLDKDRERARIDLRRQTAEGLPDGVGLRRAERRDGGWILTFTARKYEEYRNYQAFGSFYYDAAGTEYEITQFSSGAGDDPDGAGFPAFEITIPLSGYGQDTVWLTNNFSRVAAAEPPVEVAIK